MQARDGLVPAGFLTLTPPLHPSFFYSCMSMWAWGYLFVWLCVYEFMPAVWCAACWWPGTPADTGRGFIFLPMAACVNSVMHTAYDNLRWSMESMLAAAVPAPGLTPLLHPGISAVTFVDTKQGSVSSLNLAS